MTRLSDDGMLSAAEAAELVGITKQGLDGLLKRRKIEPEVVDRVTGYRLYRREVIEELKRERDARKERKL